MWGSVLQAVFPARCAGCGAPAAALCEACLLEVRPAPGGPPPPGVDWWVAPFAYEGPVRELVARAKYRQARTGLPWLAARVAAVLRAAPAEVDLVTWPPTTPRRRRQRGFDQAEVLARLVAREIGRRPARLLERGPGAAQTGRSRLEREQGPRLDARRRLDGLAVVVVDDVATTGATLSAAAGALRIAGAAVVGAATAARTGRKLDGRGATLLKPAGPGAET